MLKPGMIALGLLLVGAILTSPAESRDYWESYDEDHDGLFGYDWDYDYYRPGMKGYFRDSYADTQDRRWKSDRELKQDVRSQLAWSPFIDADGIQVSVKDGKVTLRGTVEDQSAVEEAVENAYEAGAKKVISKLKTEEEK